MSSSKQAGIDEGFFAHHGIWGPGVRLFRNLAFGPKAWIVALFLAAPLIGIIGWQLQKTWTDSVRARHEALANHVHIAEGVLQWAHGLEKSGALTRDQAQKQARDIIRTMRFDGDNYLFISDMHPKMVMHPIKPELEGKDVTQSRDPNGLALFVAFADKVRADGRGNVAYMWPKPGASKPADKVSYVAGFAPWGWILGAGIYVDDLYAALLRQLALASGIALAALLTAAYWFVSFFKVVDGGMKETSRHLRAVRDGDLTTRPRPWGRDEASELMLELAAMQDSLRSTVGQVRESGRLILGSSEEVARGSSDLSTRTEQTAASLEQSSASMEQIAATVRSTTDNTLSATSVAEENALAAAEGAKATRDVVSTMQDIHRSSSRIGEIIGTIDGIAFQTNILALNAAVEAARAGEQGRGFAVVAAEVRMLAQRSAEAAREIKTLIQTSLGQVESGVLAVQRAGKTIDDVVGSSERVKALLSEIAVGAREQSQGVEHIGTAIRELDTMTQQNAAMVEQTAAASAAMRDQAGVLDAAVRQFKLAA